METRSCQNCHWPCGSEPELGPECDFWQPEMALNIEDERIEDESVHPTPEPLLLRV